MGRLIIPSQMKLWLSSVTTWSDRRSHWWVYPSDTFLWPSIFDFLPFYLHHRSSNKHDLLRYLHKPSCDHHRLYPIPIAPSAWYHFRDLSYDLQTTLLYFPFLVSFLLPGTSCHSLTYHKSLHCAVSTLSYVSLHTNLVLILLIIHIQDFCIYSKKKGSFSPELRLKFISSQSFCLTPSCTITPAWTFVLHHFALLDTTSGDHFTALKSHPSEPHRIYT